MAKRDYAASTAQIIEKVGGEANINSCFHCATRLRFDLKDMSLADEDGILQVPGVLGVKNAGGMFQVVVGQDVDEYYKIVEAVVGAKATGEVDADEVDGEGAKKGIADAVLDYISGTMAPIIPPLVGCSLLRGFLVILTTFGIMAEDSSTYAIWYAATNAVYYFLPILAAFSAARKLNVNPFTAACIVGALLVPQFTALYTETGNIVSFLGLPVMMFDYASSLFPALIAVWMYSYAEKWLNKVLPADLKLIFIPFIGVAVFVPLTAMVFGPIAYYLAQGIAAIFNVIYAISPILSGALVGGGFAFLVILGIHWAVVPVVLNELALYNYSVLFGIWWFANMSQWTLPLGILWASKDRSEKSVAATNLFTCLISGITEPIMFGYVLRNKRFAVPIIAAGGITGALAGLLGVKALSFSMPCLLTIPTVTSNGGIPLFVGLMLLEFVIGAVVTKMFVYKDGAQRQ